MTETLYNGIELPEDWPPSSISFEDSQPIPVPYLQSPPTVIPIDLGRQLFVDDFLIDQTTMTRVYHRPTKYPCNPVMFPQSEDELHSDYQPCAVAKCGGVWHDDRDGRFKMWYMAGYTGAMVYAESDDGVHWHRPELDVVPGTNLCLPREIHPDSGTVWIDHETDDAQARYKMLQRESTRAARVRTGITKGDLPALLMTSPDGIHWTEPIETGPMGDRSTMFYNPFRKKWVQSIRSSHIKCGRCRRYWEHEDFLQSGGWQAADEPTPWARADCFDEAGDILPQLYTLDAVPYESVFISLQQILKGPPNPIGKARCEPKLTELVLGTSRDGFHWHRPDRQAFIGAHRVPGSWEFGYVEASGGVCLIVGDELWFYYSAYAGNPSGYAENELRSGMYGNGAVGLAKLRRDGFVSMQPRFAGATLRTRPVTFTGDRLFVNANTVGAELRVAVLHENGEPVEGCTAEQCVPFVGNSTCAEVRWKDENALAALKGQPVRFEFQMDRGALFAFWVTASSTGASGGYLAAGGPGLAGSRDL